MNMGETEWCAELVSDGYRSYQCSRKALPGQRFCKQHSPEAKAERDRISRDRYEAKRQQEAEARERDAVTLLRGLGYTVIEPEGKGAPQ